MLSVLIAGRAGRRRSQAWIAEFRCRVGAAEADIDHSDNVYGTGHPIAVDIAALSLATRITGRRRAAECDADHDDDVLRIHDNAIAVRITMATAVARYGADGLATGVVAATGRDTSAGSRLAGVCAKAGRLTGAGGRIPACCRMFAGSLTGACVAAGAGRCRS